MEKIIITSGGLQKVVSLDPVRFPDIAEDKEMGILTKVYNNIMQLKTEKHCTAGDYRLLNALYLNDFYGMWYCRWDAVTGRWVAVSYEEIRGLPSSDTINRLFRFGEVKDKKVQSARVEEKRRGRQVKLGRWFSRKYDMVRE